MAESPLQLISEIGTELVQLTRFNKSVFLKLLKQAVSVLSEIEQPVTLEASKKQKALKELEIATKPLRKSILKHGLIRKNDKEVRLFVVICVSEIFRILAPEPPFEDKYLRGFFEVVVGTFKELGDTACPFFSRRVKILETVARCKCFVIMLDIDCSDLVLEMFNNFFSIVRSVSFLSLFFNY
ncbi:sister chromatid cohesion protein PDS5 homolog A-like [Pistacia vera]|uniref:sister chromatid cohesion protein PDS5 homolog A-like n=1 Tax=Pistacia vera TaxID=55513 RepID=UPI001262E0F5|nr:sister chromatid cohesion protein PDS5 homolog A-like [Pistacia vera]